MENWKKKTFGLNPLSVLLRDMFLGVDYAIKKKAIRHMKNVDYWKIENGIAFGILGKEFARFMANLKMMKSLFINPLKIKMVFKFDVENALLKQIGIPNLKEKEKILLKLPELTNLHSMNIRECLKIKEMFAKFANSLKRDEAGGRVRYVD